MLLLIIFAFFSVLVTAYDGYHSACSVWYSKYFCVVVDGDECTVTVNNNVQCNSCDLCSVFEGSVQILFGVIDMAANINCDNVEPRFNIMDCPEEIADDAEGASSAPAVDSDASTSAPADNDASSAPGVDNNDASTSKPVDNDASSADVLPSTRMPCATMLVAAITALGASMF